MFNELIAHARKTRWPQDQALLLAVLALLAIGLVMVTSASLQIAESNFRSPFYFFRNHSLYLVLAMIAGATAYALVPLRLLEQSRFLGYLAALLILVVVLLPGVGREVNGAQRWIAFAGFTLQASEVAKLGYLIWLAGYINSKQEALKTDLVTFLVPLLMLSVLVLLLLLEPDFGAAVVMMLATFGMLFMAGVPVMRFLTIGLLAVLAGGGLAVLQPYRVARLTNFTDPWADQFGAGYQLVQSLIAFGRGDLTGVGLGNSVQKLFYLPEAHTDFVFAVTAEEWGLLGSLTVIALFAFVLHRIYQLSWKLLEGNKIFAGQLVLGIALVISAQVFVNIGVNMGLLPTKGLTLPLISYGGSSLLIVAMMLGWVLRSAEEVAVPVATTRRGRA